MTTTTRMLEAYIQDSPTPMFLTGFFRTPRENYHDSEEIEWDVEREEEDISTPMNRDAGYHFNEAGAFDNKKVKPPAYKEASAISASSVGRVRTAGVTKYTDPMFLRDATSRAIKAARKNEKKIRRAMELQASQLFTTGKLVLVDSSGATVFDLDYKPKATHFPTTSVPWSTTATADPIGDLLALCEVLRNDGLEDPRRAILGSGSLEAALKVTAFKDRFETRRADLGSLYPIRPNEAGTRGGQYRGTIDLGNYKLDLWTYGGRYKHPQTGTKTLYVPDKKVIVMGDGRLDATFGGMKNFNTFAAPIPFLRGRAIMTVQGIDMFFNNWIEPDGEVLNIGVSARPLLIPTAIDTYGCLDTDLA